ncbi:MAG TPA: LamG domain-containing protein [Gemmataceae bacterium]|nr:LamG domain-containing protein [Gemmataceae bacterium]
MRKQSCLALAVLGLFLSMVPAKADYPSTVLADSPIAYYRLGESSGGIAVDSSGSGLNGLYFGGYTQGVSGAIANDSDTAVSFDGASSHIRVLSAVGDDFSVELWMNTTTDSLFGAQGYQGTGLVWSDVPGTANDWIVAYLNDVACFFTGNPDDSIIGMTPLNDGNWHHIVATRVKGGDKNLYVDGNLEANGTTNGNTLMGNPVIEIGGNTLDRRYFAGSLDEVAFYSAALTPNQVLTHYKAGIGP